MKAFAIVLSLILSTALSAQMQDLKSGKVQALIVTGEDTHDWRGITPLLRKALEDSGRFDVRICEEFRGATAEMLETYDVVILMYSDHDLPQYRWGDATNASLRDFVGNGKGLVMYHHSTTAFKGWPEYQKLSGANYYPGHGQHSPLHDFKVDIVDQSHPITRGLKKSFLQTHDELYGNMLKQPAGTFHVLATAWDDHALYQGKARQPIPGPGTNEPMVWTLNYEKGRVFAIMIGHEAQATQTPGFQALFPRGTEWAATNAVTLPIPDNMRDDAAATASK